MIRLLLMQPIEVFQEEVWDFYAKHGRSDLPWRQPEPSGKFNPYKIMVSEIMLQQTQVKRVIPKYEAFLSVFPTVAALAETTFPRVLEQWNGLGYNRRAKFLLEAARIINTSQTPQTPEAFAQLPGIGPNTAAAICVYSYNQPYIFIETNIRSVFIHHFFEDREDVADKEILPLVESTLDKETPRAWYWALMDYGSHLKNTIVNPSRRSKHHTMQSRFEGSRRQLRAQVLRSLLRQSASYSKLQAEFNDDRLRSVLDELNKENLIIDKNRRYRLAET